LSSPGAAACLAAARIAVGVVAGCAGSASDVPGVSRPVVAAAPAAVAPAVPTTWTVDNARDLQPISPQRQGRVLRPLAAIPEYERVLGVLGKVVDSYAGDADNPWAIAHGILARGPEFKLADGRPAVGHLFAAFGERRNIGPLTFVGFPRSRGDVRVEPHTDLILKNLAEAGLEPSVQVQAGDAQFELADFYRYTLLKTYLVAAENRSSYDNTHDMSWGLQALATWAPTHPLRWTGPGGEAMDLDELTHFVVAVLTQESKFMFDAMRAGRKFERSGQPLFSYPCGGSHLVQGASYAVARGFGRPEDRAYIEAQVALLLYRRPIELELYDRAVGKHRQHRLRIGIQRMKFLGHWLETMGKLEALGVLASSDARQLEIESAAQNLVLAVAELEDLGVFDRLPQIRADDEQQYLDIVGDSAHAIRGLGLVLGRGSIAY
jgi:hypothetical protein